jgi:hypothetical protein
MLDLKISVEAQVVVGPFISSTDGKTLLCTENGSALTSQSGTLIKNGSYAAFTPTSWVEIGTSTGMYNVGLAATDTDTLGTLQLEFSESGYLSVWQNFNVVTLAYYNLKYTTILAQQSVGNIYESTTYADVVFASLYFESRLHTTAWDEASPEDRSKALSMATRHIDRLSFTGCKTDEDQANEFPRDDEVTPEDIRIACCEEALAILDGVDVDRELENAGVISEGFSGVRTTYDRTSVPEHIGNGIASASAWRYLKPYLRDSKSLTISRVS